MNQNQDQIDKHQKALDDLKLSEDNLEEEIGNLQHELRRVKDGIERVGGSSHSLEQEAKQLLSNIDLCERDLMRNRNQQNRLSEQVNTLKNTSDN